MAATLHTWRDRKITRAMEFWYANQVVPYKIAPPGQEVQWYYRAATMEDAVVGVALQASGKDWRKHNFGEAPPPAHNWGVAHHTRILVEDYEDLLAERRDAISRVRDLQLVA